MVVGKVALLPLGDHVSDLDSLQHKLCILKNEAKVWIKDKHAQIDYDYYKIEQAITSLLSGSSNGILSTENMAHLAHLRSERKLILNHYLLTWKLKSRAKWALQGDSNTKYFHMLASGRRNQNSIWSLSDEDGNIYEDETTLKDLGLSHFANIFKDDGGTFLFH